MPDDRQQQPRTRLATPRVAIVAAGFILVWALSIGMAQEPDAASATAELEAVFAEDRFPSATTCAPCHAEIYR